MQIPLLILLASPLINDINIEEYPKNFLKQIFLHSNKGIIFTNGNFLL